MTTEPKQMALTTPDIRQERIEQLKRLMPDLFDGEGKLDEHALKALIDPEGNAPHTERFRFEWAGKHESKRLAFTPSRGALVADKDRSIDFDNTENLILEGDNLEVLKLLQTSYFEKIKCIYIDPPYNTQKDFIYPDKFAEGKKAYWMKNGTIKDGVKLTAVTEQSGRKHSNWLNMMQARLLLAWQLLRPDGAIVIHIDENENHRLRMLLDDVFGEENFLGEVVWDKRNPKGDSGKIAYQHESVLCFAKDIDKFKASNPLIVPKRNAQKMLAKAERIFKQVGTQCIPESTKDALKTLGITPTDAHKRLYTLEDANADFQTWIKSQGSNFSGGEVAYKFIDKSGEVYQPVSMAWPNNDKAPDEYFIPLKHPVTGKDCPVPSKGWRNPLATMKDLIRNNEVVFGNDETIQPRRKYPLKGNMNENLASLLYYGASDDKLLEDFGTPFENPKPVEVVKRFIQAFTSKQDIVMDFFAGSGTTAHAVLELNNDLKFILVQVPEYIDENHAAYKKGYKTISQLCMKRVELAGEKLKKEHPQAIVDTGFRVYKLTDSHFPENLYTADPNKSDEENRQALEAHLNAPRQATLFESFDDAVCEIALKNGFGLFYTLEALAEFTENKVYRLTGGGKSCLLCLDDTLEESTLEALTAGYSDTQLVCSRRALDTTTKWQLQSAFNENLWMV